MTSTYAYKGSGWRFQVDPAIPLTQDITRNMNRSKMLAHESQPPRALFLSQIKLAHAIESVAQAQDLEEVKRQTVMALRELAYMSHGIDYVVADSPKI